MKRIIQKNWKPFSAVVGLMLISLVVGTYILVNQRLRIPLLSDRPVIYEVAFDNANAVTPGQGQTVQVAGVEIGQIGPVKLEEGRAVVKLEVEPRFQDLIKTDALATLRPRTGLKDMYVQIFPGRGKQAKPGFQIPLANTQTDVDPEEVLAELDERTQDYIKLLAHGLGDGVRENGSEIAELFRRFGPTVRDLARVNRSVAREHQALRRVVTSLADINGELARRPEDLTRLVQTSSETFGALAAEERDLRDTVDELPDTLRRGSETMRDLRPLARELGPATRALLPAMRRLPRTNRDLRGLSREITPVIRGEIRPFVRAARPVVDDLADASRSLNASFPELTRSARVLNDFFNMLAHNPNGREAAGVRNREEGYLFWIAWLTHMTRNLQNIEDANGPMRPIFLTGTCGTLASFVSDEPALEFGLNLSPLLATVCGDPETPSTDLEAVTDFIDAILPGRTGKDRADDEGGSEEGGRATSRSAGEQASEDSSGEEGEPGEKFARSHAKGKKGGGK